MPLAPARLLDLTRLVSRLGRGVLTGIDRVELAYLERLLADPLPVFALVRTGPGFVLLDRAGACAVAQRAKGALPVGAADFLGWLTRRTEPLRARAEADLRRLALARAAPPLLGRMLRRHLPAGVSYINVGHANLTARVMRAVQTVPGARTAVLVHDVIPLDFPEFTRPGISAVFAHKMAVVAKYADLVICSTEDAKRRVHAQLARLDPAPSAVVPLIVVMALGVPEPHPDKAALPAGLNLAAPYFVIIGTIEPRKNHALLLDVWDRLPDPATLIIIGGRGWADAGLFRRIEAAEAAGRGVIAISDLADGAVAALLNGAEALLFPSLAEGYGLPLVEAAALGVPVVCSDLPVFREILDSYPVYLDPADNNSWMETIAKLTLAARQRGGDKAKTGQRRASPDWADHFNAVLSLV